MVSSDPVRVRSTKRKEGGKTDDEKNVADHHYQCPVPDKLNIATRRGIGSNGHQTEELYARVQTQSGLGKHAA